MWAGAEIASLKFGPSTWDYLKEGFLFLVFLPCTEYPTNLKWFGSCDEDSKKPSCSGSSSVLLYSLEYTACTHPKGYPGYDI